MRTKRLTFSIALITILAVQAACNFPSAEQPDPAATLNALYTQSAQTLEAMASQAAQTSIASQPAVSPTASFPTNTFVPGINTPTPIPPIKTNTPITRCDWADFIVDVTYPDGSVIGRNIPFTKIWRLKNVGTCSWTTSYTLVFVEGDSMSAPVAVALPGTVNPGQTIDLAINLISPNKDGRYKGNYNLRNASGGVFGVGNQAATTFYVDIKVTGTNFTAYDFAAHY